MKTTVQHRYHMRLNVIAHGFLSKDEALMLLTDADDMEAELNSYDDDLDRITRLADKWGMET